MVATLCVPVYVKFGWAIAVSRPERTIDSRPVRNRPIKNRRAVIADFGLALQPGDDSDSFQMCGESLAAQQFYAYQQDACISELS